MRHRVAWSVANGVAVAAWGAIAVVRVGEWALGQAVRWKVKR